MAWISLYSIPPAYAPVTSPLTADALRMPFCLVEYGCPSSSLIKFYNLQLKNVLGSHGAGCLGRGRGWHHIHACVRMLMWFCNWLLSVLPTKNVSSCSMGPLSSMWRYLSGPVNKIGPPKNVGHWGVSRPQWHSRVRIYPCVWLGLHFWGINWIKH